MKSILGETRRTALFPLIVTDSTFEGSRTALRKPTMASWEERSISSMDVLSA
mgnify:CR=1 FL=1